MGPRRKRADLPIFGKEHGTPAPHEQLSLAVLAGGRSRRMGEDKAFAEFGGTTLIQWTLDRLADVFPHMFIVAKDVERYRRFGFPVVADALPSSAPTVGVYSAVLASPTESTLCLACDIPFVTPAVLTALAERSVGHDAAVPKENGWLQPMCAVYSRATLGVLQEMLDADERRIDLLYDRVDTLYVDVAELGAPRGSRVFLNVNTQADLATARTAMTEARAPEHGPTHQVRHFATRVEQFMAKVVLPTVSFVGKKKSGKTTALEAVIAELTRRGRRVAAVKHDAHSFTIDVSGTDSRRLREAGATVTVVSSPHDVAVMSRVGEDLPLTALVARIREPVDVVLTEGFSRQPAPKVEISRAARSDELIAPPDEVLAVMADHPVRGQAVPVYGLDDHVAVADRIDELVADWRTTYLATTSMAQERHVAARGQWAGGLRGGGAGSADQGVGEPGSDLPPT